MKRGFYFQLLGTIIIFILGLYRLSLAYSMDTWPSVKGEVIEAKLHNNSSYYLPRITYKYCYKMDCYFSKKIANDSTGQRKLSKGMAEKLMSNLVGRGFVLVYINPSNPKDSILIKVSYLSGILITLVGLVSLIRLALIRRRFYKE